MPESVLSKLSPLSKRDSDYFASLVSKQSLSSDHAKFCSMANLACSVLPGKFHKLDDGYNSGYGGRTFHADEADPNSFFRLSILEPGNRVHLPNLNNQIPRRSFLPSQIASKISTSSNDLQKMFPESFTSPATKEAIETSLLYCSSPALKGEIKGCPKSLEDMIEFSKKVLGVKQLVALTSKSTKGSGKELIIGNIKQFDAEKVVSCHEVFFPFAAYFCHLISSTHLYAVDLVEPETRAPVNKILAICHMDTSSFSADHVAFKILKASPGQTEACHWFSKIDLAWLANAEI
ncbi:polygalacturonase-1 non-catalytic subunit beta [Coffea arabica]|uniref:Polygalacturonase-1 non-catalytic subunit beta n=1 Tax=Coffea arabica TaxID=13443 RepID=A0A6P6WTF9_COFAR